MKKAAGDTKVQKLIGKKKASGRGRGRGRGRGNHMPVESPQDQDENLDGAEGGDENGDDGDEHVDGAGESKGEPPSTPNGALQESWAAIDSWECFNKDFFLRRRTKEKRVSPKPFSKKF